MKVTVDEKNGKLIIELALNEEPVLSKSGKSYLIAGTGGFTNAGASYKGKPISLGINATVPLK